VKFRILVWALLALGLTGLLAWGAMLEYRRITVLAPANPAEVIDEAVAQLRQRALNAGRVDWVEARRIALETAGSGRLSDLDFALYDLVHRLGDGHSFYLPARAVRPLLSPSEASGTNPLGLMLPVIDGVPRLAVNAYASLDPAQGRQAAAGLRKLVTGVLQDPGCGLLLDLTNNQGGNMYPMLQGLLPLLPLGVWLHFRDASGSLTALRRDGDGLWIGETRMDGPAPVDVQAVRRMPMPIAVLMGPNTASSGEMVALAFKGLPNVRYFGKATAGLTSGNEPIALKHGGLIAVTTMRVVDRSGHVYEGSVRPDEPIEDADAAARAAAAWVRLSCTAQR
jgi:hypothetical protein